MKLGPLLLEEPELSLHPDVVRFLPQMFARMQRRTGRQVLVSSHSADLLRDEGIGLDQVLLLRPAPEGTRVEVATNLSQAKTLVKAVFLCPTPCFLRQGRRNPAARAIRGLNPCPCGRPSQRPWKGI